MHSKRKSTFNLFNVSTTNGQERLELYFLETAIPVVSMLFDLAVFLPYLMFLAMKRRDIEDTSWKKTFIANLKLLIALVVIAIERQKGVEVSFVLFWFWFLQFCASSYRLVTALTLQYTDLQTSVFAIILLTVCLFQLIVYGFIGSCRTIKGNAHPIPSASIISLFTLSWMTPIFIEGWKNSLKFQDLWTMHKWERSGELGRQFQNIWNKVLENNETAPKENSNSDSNEEAILLIRQDRRDTLTQDGKRPMLLLLKSLLLMFGKDLSLGFLLMMIKDMLMLAQTIIFKFLIESVEKKEDNPSWYGWLLVAGFAISGLLQRIIRSHANYMTTFTSQQLKSALTTTLFNKCIRLSDASRQATGGHVVSLVSVDVFNLARATYTIIRDCSQFFLIIGCFVMFFIILGTSGITAVAILIAITIFIVILTKFAVKYQIEKMKYTDRRVKLTNELLTGIEAVKLETLEENFCHRITDKRNAEIHVIKKAMLLFTLAKSLMNIAPSVIQFLTFLTVFYMEPSVTLSPSTIFNVIAIFNVLQQPLNAMPSIGSTLSKSVVSLKRLGDFLLLEEIDETAVSQNDKSNGNAVDINRGTFYWKIDGIPALKNVCLQVKPGKLVAVVGNVGSGKSSLLSALIGDMVKSSGEVVVNGTCGYVAQKPWIQNATVKENILFSNPEDPGFYQKVINACALTADIEILPDGDDTEIGERGVTLSGGQRQRVALARAAYAKADVYLLDDPLSAVDSYTACHIFGNVIGPNGLLAEKTRIWVTHRLNFLPQCDSIVVFANGTIEREGTFRDQLQHSDTFKTLINTYVSDGDEAEASELLELIAEQGRKDIAETMSLSRKSHTFSGCTTLVNLTKERSRYKITSQEKISHGQIETNVLLEYVRSLGVVALLFVLVFLSVSQTSSIGSQDVLAKWSNVFIENSTDAVGKADPTFLVIGILASVEVIVTTIALFVLAFGTLRAATNFHDRLLAHTLRATMLFFESTPSARIISRFSDGINAIDTTLTDNLIGLATTSVQAAAAFTIIAVKLPVFLSVAIPLSVIYFLVRMLYVATTRQVKRLESISNSPVLNKIFEVADGLSTIRAFKKEKHFQKEFGLALDENYMTRFHMLMSQSWLFFQTAMIGTLVVTATVIFGFLQQDYLTPGTFALALSYAMTIPEKLNWIVRFSSQAETDMVAVERIFQFLEAPTEADWSCPLTDKNLNHWPQKGGIIFENVQLRYRKGFEAAIRGLSFNVRPKEKIGIVGRTGAGKSSLANALLRIVELEQGKIEIDGIDIKTIGIHPLRRAIIALPQISVLFSGSLRSNLDPHGMHSDEEIIRCLELVNLREWLENEAKSLEFIIADQGDNLSSGQRQLLCMARALLRQRVSKGYPCGNILLMDEATAAVDANSDRIISQLVHAEFKNTTVLTIAHRLDTVMSYDRIMVLANGKMVEFDSPSNLLSNPASEFHKMAIEAGLNN